MKISKQFKDIEYEFDITPPVGITNFRLIILDEHEITESETGYVELHTFYPVSCVYQIEILPYDVYLDCIKINGMEQVHQHVIKAHFHSIN